MADTGFEMSKMSSQRDTGFDKSLLKQAVKAKIDTHKKLAQAKEEGDTTKIDQHQTKLDAINKRVATLTDAVHGNSFVRVGGRKRHGKTHKKKKHHKKHHTRRR